MIRYISILLGLLAGAGVVSAQTAPEPPDCTTDKAVTLLKEVVTNSPQGRAGGLTLFEVEKPRSIGRLSASELPRGVVVVGAPEKSVCEAVVYTNAGKRRVTYTLRWLDRAAGKVWMDSRLCALADEQCSNRW